MLLALALLTVLGTGLRFAGLDHLLPQVPEADDNLGRQTMALMKRGGWEPHERGLDAYPRLVSRLATLWPAAPSPGTSGRPDTLEEHLAAASVYHVRVRSVVAIFSSALVPLTFLLASRFTSPWGALAAAAFVAFDPLHLLFSSQARPHGVIATLMLLALLAAMRMRRRPTLWSYALAGSAAALALGALHSGVAVLLPLLVAHLARERGDAPARWWRVLVPASIVSVSCAYFYLDIWRALAVSAPAVRERGALVQGVHRVSIDMFGGGGLGSMTRVLLGTSPTLAVLALAGALVAAAGAVRRRPMVCGDALVALSFALPYFIVLAAFDGTMERFLLPLLPYFAVLAAVALVGGAALLRERLAARPARVALAGGALVAFGLPALVSSKLAWLRTRPDTYQQVAAMLQEEFAADARPMLVPGVELPLFYAREALYEEDGVRGRSPGLWSRYQRETGPGARSGREYPFHVLSYRRGEEPFSSVARCLELIRERAPDCIVLEVSNLHRARPEWQNLHAAVEQWGILGARFRPDGADEAQDRQLYCRYIDGFMRRLLTARALGSELAVYRPRADPAGPVRASTDGESD